MNRTGPFKANSIQRWLYLLLTFALLLPFSNAAYAANGESSGEIQPSPASAFTPEMNEALTKAERLLYEQQPFPEWAALGFSRNGTPLPAGFLERKADELLDNSGVYDQVTELAQSMISYGASGGNVNFIAGLDLYPLLMNHPGMEKEGIYGLASAYLAGSESYSNSLERTEWYPDLIYYSMLDRQLSDGSWGEPNSEQGSIKATAAALIALSDMPGNEAVQPALQWLKDRLQEFNNPQTSGTTEEMALAISALSSLQTDAGVLVDLLLSRELPDGGFAQKDNGSLDHEATLQAYLALTAYKLYLNGENKLFANWNHPASGSAVIQIEGPSGTIAIGRGQTGEALETAAAFLQQQSIPFTLKSESAGKYEFASIEGIENGKYGGSDGWRIAVKDKYGSWKFPTNFPAGLSLGDGDELLVYYGSENTDVIDTLDIEWVDQYTQTTHGTPNAYNPFILNVKRANRYLGYLTAAGVTVEINGTTYVSDAEGRIAVDGLAPGVYRMTFTGYRDNAAPLIAKRILQLRVSAPELSAFKDEEEISEWARSDMAFLLSEGYMKGISAKSNMLAPKQALTRAEFAVLLLRQMNESVYPKPENVYTDVPASKWYSDELAEAAALGIADRASGAFEPDRAITREEAAIMAAHAGQLKTYGTMDRMKFDDISGLTVESRLAVQAIFEHGIMEGSAGSFRPHETLVREQAATILTRLHTLLYRNTTMF